MIIDFHTHNFPDALAPRAIAAMVENLRHAFVPFGDGTLACQLADATANAILLGIFAFMRPVITSADGRCVAMTRCIPAARPICAMRIMDSSTSFAAAIIKSAYSSITTTILGSGFKFLFLNVKRWYSASFLTPFSENIL